MNRDGFQAYLHIVDALAVIFDPVTVDLPRIRYVRNGAIETYREGI